jgi:nucleoside-diphosphate-sugar epimerase
MNRQLLPITGTGDETRDFTYVGDIINGLLAMAYYNDAIGEAFNLGTGREIAIRDLAIWINEITHNDKGIRFQNRREWDKKTRLLSSIEKSKRVLKYTPKMDFKEGLNYVYAWFNDNMKNIKKVVDI